MNNLLRILKTWQVPVTILCFLVLAMIFRWDDMGTTTNGGVIIKTARDRWNGAVWQETIRNGSFNERIIQPSWIEVSRKPVEKQEQYEVADYSKATLKSGVSPEMKKLIEQSELTKAGFYDSYFDNITYTTKTRSIQVTPEPIYWLSRNGLTKIWIYIISVMVIWFSIALILRNKKKKDGISSINLSITNKP